MSIQHTHFSDVTAPAFDARNADGTARRRLGLYEPALRERHLILRTRFEEHGPDTLIDEEVLELLLLRSLPRKDTRPLAKALLAEFGDFASVLAANEERLDPLCDLRTAQDLKLVQAAAQRMAKSRISQRPLISSWDAVLTYCRTTLAHKETEEFRVLFLDRRNVLIADDVMGVGTVDHVPVYPREVLKRALKLNACALILIHNHPSGDPTPSPSDIEMTRTIKQAAESLSITLHDHLIIGASGETSLASQGLI